MLYTPQNEIIARHIDYYWIVDDARTILGNSVDIHAYPGITPDMIIVRKGFYQFEYLGERVKQNQSRLFSFIHKEVRLNLSTLDSFILVKFKSRGLGSLLPFVDYSAEEIMQNSIGLNETVFGGTMSELEKLLKGFSKIQIIHFLDSWFFSYYKKEREGFVIEMAESISPSFNLQKIMSATNYSYSTISRYFKRETGLSPKKFQTLWRCKAAVTDICTTKNNDWMYYVSKYNYYDQAHFIKDIKEYTKFTPSQLITTPSFVSYRPQL